METTKEESKSVETNSQDVKETVEKEDNFDYKKAREERITKSTERRILKELGEDSFEAVKNKLKDALNFKSELEKERINGHKLKVLESGFDSKYLDFIVYEVSRTKEKIVLMIVWLNSKKTTNNISKETKLLILLQI